MRTDISFGRVIDDPRTVVMMVSGMAVWKRRCRSRRAANRVIEDWNQVSKITGAALGATMLDEDRDLKIVDVDLKGL